MRALTDTQSDLFTVTRTSFPTAYVNLRDQRAQLGHKCWDLYRSSPPTVHMLSPLPGTRLSASGSSLLVPQPDVLSATLTMFSPSPSLPTTAKSSLDPATEQSSSGTLLVTASSPLLRRDTPTGFLAFGSAPTHKTLSLSAADGTSWLRWEIFLCWVQAY